MSKYHQYIYTYILVFWGILFFTLLVLDSIAVKKVSERDRGEIGKCPRVVIRNHAFSIKFQHQKKLHFICCHQFVSTENQAFPAARLISICLSIDSIHKAICLISAKPRVYNGTVSATVECTFKEWYCCVQGPSEI